MKYQNLLKFLILLLGKCMNKSLISIADLKYNDLEKIFKQILLFKKNKASNRHKGKSVGLLFEKFSTRTRLSFEVAISRLGAYPIYINKSDTQLSRGESIKETAKMFSLYLDALVYRTSKQKHMEDFVNFSDIPVINALSDFEHPTQIISDIFSIKEMKPTENIKKIKILYIGDGNNIANSLCLIAGILDLNLIICCPKGYEPDSKILKSVKNKIKITHNPQLAIKNVDIVYTDIWTSMGMEGEEKRRLKDFKKFQVNSDLIQGAKKDHIFLHCLPAHIGEEVSKEIIESKNSAVYLQAENKIYTAMAIIDHCLS